MGKLHWKGLEYFSGLIRYFTSEFTWSIANSKITADSVRMYSGKNISVIYNGIVTNRKLGKSGQLLKLLGLSGDVKIVGIVGSLVGIKGHRYFIDAASKICSMYDNVHFIAIGGQTAAGQREYVTSLRSRISELGLEANVHFLGHRSDAFELTGDMDIATVCTLPPGEGFGLVIVEAMLQGVPVISTNVGASLEIIQHGKSGILIPPADTNALVKEIVTLIDNDKILKEIGLSGRKECIERFGIQKTAREVEYVYKTLLT